MTPFFGAIICLWGGFFLEFFKRRNSELAFEWNVTKFEKYETDLPEYTKRRKEVRDMNTGFRKFVFNHEQRLKKIVSYSILILMVRLIKFIQILRILLDNVMLFFYVDLLLADTSRLSCSLQSSYNQSSLS